MLFDWIMNLSIFTRVWITLGDPSVKSHGIDALVMRPSLKLASSWFLQFQQEKQGIDIMEEEGKNNLWLALTSDPMRPNETSHLSLRMWWWCEVILADFAEFILCYSCYSPPTYTNALRPGQALFHRMEEVGYRILCGEIPYNICIRTYSITI